MPVAQLNIKLDFDQIVFLISQLSETDKMKLSKLLVKETIETDNIETYFASENTLAKDWLNPIEDDAWQDL